MRKAGTRTSRIPASSWYLLKLLVGLCLPPDREAGDVAGGGVTDIGTDGRQDLDAVAGAHRSCSCVPAASCGFGAAHASQDHATG